MLFPGLARKFQDPYGNDLEDLSVLFYVTFTLKNSAQIMGSQRTGFKDCDTNVETEMVLTHY